MNDENDEWTNFIVCSVGQWGRKSDRLPIHVQHVFRRHSVRWRDGQAGWRWRAHTRPRATPRAWPFLSIFKDRLIEHASAGLRQQRRARTW